MQPPIPYGEEFVRHLTTLNRQTPFNYKDLQQIKAMNRADLAERLKSECPQIAEFVLLNSARDVAEEFIRKGWNLRLRQRVAPGFRGPLRCWSLWFNCFLPRFNEAPLGCNQLPRRCCIDTVPV